MRLPKCRRCGPKKTAWVLRGMPAWDEELQNSEFLYMASNTFFTDNDCD